MRDRGRVRREADGGDRSSKRYMDTLYVSLLSLSLSLESLE